jgi:hypothetical protein
MHDYRKYQKSTGMPLSCLCEAGANIESLAVGLNIDKALFTIVVTGTASTVVRHTAHALASAPAVCSISREHVAENVC